MEHGARVRRTYVVIEFERGGHVVERYNPLARVGGFQDRRGAADVILLCGKVRQSEVGFDVDADF
jgi:hypothetical protein